MTTQNTRTFNAFNTRSVRINTISDFGHTRSGIVILICKCVAACHRSVCGWLWNEPQFVCANFKVWESSQQRKGSFAYRINTSKYNSTRNDGARLNLSNGIDHQTHITMAIVGSLFYNQNGFNYSDIVCRWDLYTQSPINRWNVWIHQCVICILLHEGLPSAAFQVNGELNAKRLTTGCTIDLDFDTFTFWIVFVSVAYQYYITHYPRTVLN